MSLVGCELCDISRDQEKLLDRTHRSFIIEDMSSASAIRHILVCPFEHVETIDDLSQKKDIELVKDMYQLGHKFLTKLHPGEEYRFGFNESPDVNVYHLHLHGYVIPCQNKSKDEMKNGHILKSPEEILQLLYSRRKESSPKF